jgi:uncharacterized protein
MEQRLSLITLGVSDLVRARTFYEALGWRAGGASDDGAPTGDPPSGDIPPDPVFFQAGGMIVALWDRRSLQEDSGTTDAGGWGGVSLAYNARSEREVDDIIEEARLAGAIIARPAAPTFWGGYSGVFIDPEGHPWEIAHNPGWTIDQDGSVHLAG